MALAPWEPEVGRESALLTDDWWPADLATRLLLKEQGQRGIPMKPLSTGLVGSMPLRRGGLHDHCQLKPSLIIHVTPRGLA